MKGRCIYAIGETVFDIVFKNGKPVSATAGGSMLNSTVSLGRAGLPVALISEIGQDRVGTEIIGFLKQNRVGVKHIYRFADHSTALALAFLDENEDASYEFYKDYPAKRLNIEFPGTTSRDYILFGSFFALTKAVRNGLKQFLSSARESGSTILYDPNIRNPHAHELPGLQNFLYENISFSDIIRGSSDDFRLIFGTTVPKDVFKKVNELGCRFLIITNAGNPVTMISDKFELYIPVININPVSTIGAGDSFNAGILYGLYKMNIGRSDLSSLKQQDWSMLIDIGITFGSSVCESWENYISASLAEKIKKSLYGKTPNA